MWIANTILKIQTSIFGMRDKVAFFDSVFYFFHIYNLKALFYTFS